MTQEDGASSGYNLKGIMMSERPAGNAQTKWMGGGGALGSPSQPAFKSAVGEISELGMPPTSESRAKISSLTTLNRLHKRHTQNNALTKHRRWLSRLGRTVQINKESDEMNKLVADDRTQKFKEFTSNIRKKILSGDSLANLGWASLTRKGTGGASSDPAFVAPEAPATDSGEEAPADSAPAAELPVATKSLGKEEQEAVDKELSLFVDEAIHDAIELERKNKEERAEAAEAEASAEAAEAKEGGAPKPDAEASQRRETSNAAGPRKPAWALSEGQALQKEEAEEDNLLDFVDNLDFDSYMEGYETAQDEALDGIVSKVDRDKNEDEDEWKEDFVTALNDAVNRETLGMGAKSSKEDDRNTMVTKTSGMTTLSKMHRKHLVDPKDGADDWDTSTQVGREDKENATGKINVAANILQEQPHLKQMHSAQSMRTILEKVETESKAGT